MQEIWRPCVGFEGYYKISNFGNVESIKRNGTNGKQLKPSKDKNGYRIVLLSVFGERKNYKVHRLVAQAFIPNPENKPCVNHIDNITGNNMLNNLEWATYLENNQHMLIQKRDRSPATFLKRNSIGQFIPLKGVKNAF